MYLSLFYCTTSDSVCFLVALLTIFVMLILQLKISNVSSTEKNTVN